LKTFRQYLSERKTWKIDFYNLPEKVQRKIQAFSKIVGYKHRPELNNFDIASSGTGVWTIMFPSSVLASRQLSDTQLRKFSRVSGFRKVRITSSELPRKKIAKGIEEEIAEPIKKGSYRKLRIDFKA
jgi:hypothetical protein